MAVLRASTLSAWTLPLEFWKVFSEVDDVPECLASLIQQPGPRKIDFWQSMTEPTTEASLVLLVVLHSENQT